MRFNKLVDNIYINKKEKGITLIALIITIVLLLILAVVAINSIQGDGIFVKASQSTFLSKVKKYQEELTLYINSKELETMLKYDETTLTADKTTTPSIRDIIKSMDKADEENFIIQSGVLKYIGDSEQEKEWSEDLGLQVIYTLKRIYGNSVQNGEPTPDTPIEIESVGDRTKNLVNINDASNTNGYLDTSGVNVAPNRNDLKITNYITIPTGVTQITISGMSQNSMKAPSTCFYDKDKQFISGINFNNEKTKTLTIPENAKYFKTSFRTSYTNFMVECGSTATEYEPYGYQIPVKTSGKNLLNIDEASNNVLTVDDNKVYTMTMRNGSRFSKTINTYIPSGTTIKLSCEFLESSTTQQEKVYLTLQYADGSNLYMTYPDATVRTLEKDVVKIQLYLWSQEGNGAYYSFKNIQIEEGNTATEYEQYRGQTANIYLNEPLRKIGDYADYIDFENKKINRCIGSVDLSSASWLFQETQNRWVTGEFAKLYKKWDSADVKLNALSEEYTVYSYNAMGASVYSEIVGLCVYGSNGNMFVRNGSTTQTPTGILYYKLATPTEETIELPDIEILGSDTLTIDTKIQPSKIEK